RDMAQLPNAQNGNQEAQVANQEGQSHHGCMGLSLTGNQTSLEDELESGRR
ncbi:lipid phosphate phosphatase-like protein, partial [Trifolium medium]|nr:lipid phosphate phosphatase-like protein [Trifolium medium]